MIHIQTKTKFTPEHVEAVAALPSKDKTDLILSLQKELNEAKEINKHNELHATKHYEDFNAIKTKLTQLKEAYIDKLELIIELYANKY